MRIFRPKRDEVTEEWRKLHKVELNDLTQYCLGDKIQKDEVGGVCSLYGERRGLYGVLMGKRAGNRPFGRPRHGWEDNIEMDIEEWGVGLLPGLIWLKIGIGGGHL